MSGIDKIPLRIPERWDPIWFATFVREVLALADVRNAKAGIGIEIDGRPDQPATITASADVEELAQASLLTALPTPLEQARLLVPGEGVGLEDRGPGDGLVVFVRDVPFGRLAQIPAPSVVGASVDLGDGASPPGAIVPGAIDRVLGAVDDGDDGIELAFVQLTAGMAPDGLWAYAKLQNVSADQRLLGRASGAPAPMQELSLSQVLDFIGGASEGDILFRGVSGWERLPRGTDGQVLALVDGVPAWADPDSLLQSSFVTVDDETARLENSSQLVAGDGITIDTSNPGEIVIENDNP